MLSPLLLSLILLLLLCELSLLVLSVLELFVLLLLLVLLFVLPLLTALLSLSQSFGMFLFRLCSVLVVDKVSGCGIPEATVADAAAEFPELS